MDVGLRVPLEAEVAREGVVVLAARLVLDVVRSLPCTIWTAGRDNGALAVRRRGRR